jgi:Flp pilus assembly protein TadD
MKKFIILSFLLVLSSDLYAQVTQENKEKASQLAKQAINHINNSQTQKAVQLLKQAQQLDNESILYPYEIAVAYYEAERYDDAARVLDSLIKHPHCDDQVYQLLGNSLDFLGNKEKANLIYNLGLKKFPHSGRLYMELGAIESQNENYEESMSYWAEGTQMAPNYAPLHYRIADQYNIQNRPILSLISLEVFLNLSSNQAHFSDGSAYLFDIFNSCICKLDTCHNTFDFKLTDRNTNYLYFEYEYNELMNQIAKDLKIGSTIKLEHIAAIRKGFISAWFAKGNHKKYPNPIFTFQKELIDNGVYDVYTYWLFSEGAPDETGKWMASHQEELQKFIQWQQTNRFKFDEKQAK